MVIEAGSPNWLSLRGGCPPFFPAIWAILAILGKSWRPPMPRSDVDALVLEHPAPSDTGMVWVPGGSFRMGSDQHYPEEGPAHGARVDGFWMDRFPVTNRMFAHFVDTTGYITEAEIAPRAEDYAEADPAALCAASLVFRPPADAAVGGDWRAWWQLLAGADWRHPRGAGSDLTGLMDHPVVHVTWADAAHYAAWRGADLPTEAEWEFAARGGFAGAEFAWGDELAPDGVHRANTWQGRFPAENLAEDGFVGTSPVDAFPPNAYGLYDMIGNVWEWTDDWYRPNHLPMAQSCCTPRHKRGGGMEESLDPASFGTGFPRKVLKGGSHLCAPNYCRRYRPAARLPQTIDTSSGHIGFRCIQRVKDATTL